MKTLHISIDENTLKLMQDYAKPRNISISQFIRLAIVKYLKIENETASYDPFKSQAYLYQKKQEELKKLQEAK